MLVSNFESKFTALKSYSRAKPASVKLEWFLFTVLFDKTGCSTGSGGMDIGIGMGRHGQESVIDSDISREIN